MDSGDLEIASYTREGMIYPIDRLLAGGYDSKNYKDYQKWMKEFP